MKSGRIFGPLFAIALLAALPAGASASTCHPSGSTLLRSNSQATVYRVDDAGGHNRYFGCFKPTGARTHIATDRPGFSPVSLLRLRGHYTAFQIPGSETIKVVNLRNASRIRRDPTGLVSDLVVTRNGRFAWISFYHYHEVFWSSFATSDNHAIDSDSCSGYTPGNDCIRPDSLSPTGRHHDRQIAWRHDPHTRHFTIP